MNRNHRIALTALLILNSALCLADAPSKDSELMLSPVASLFESDELILIDNASAIARASVPDESLRQRYERLKAWVLPSETHATIRLAGVIESTSQDSPRRTAQPVLYTAPAIDLVQLAAQLNCLAELQHDLDKQLQTSVPESKEQQRARVALTIMILLQQENFDAAALKADELTSLARQSVPVVSADLWPETTVVCFAFLTSPDLANDPRMTRTGLSEFLSFLFSERTQQHIPRDSLPWHSLIACLAGRVGHREVRPAVSIGEVASDHVANDHSLWIPSSRRRAMTRGPGHAEARWARTGDRIDKLSGHDDDYLFFRCPLVGDYQIDCETSAFSCQAHYAGTFFGNDGVPGFLWQGSFRNSASRIDSKLTFSGFNEWIHHRVAVRDREVSTWLNGRRVDQRVIQPSSDPWFAVRSWWRMHAAARDIRISGTPEIPAEVDLLSGYDLSGWYAYFNEQVGEAGGHWEYQQTSKGSHLLGRRDTTLAGTFNESLLVYQRPLDEHGEIDYEFYFEPGEYDVHPTLDRSVFLIREDGIHYHRLTDGSYDRTSYAPDQSHLLPQSADSTASIPLRHRDWNHLKFSVQGLKIQISLNGQLVAEYQDATGNDRTFGLFHYADQTNSLVRNIRMRGDWPRSLPSHAEQQLANTLPSTFNVAREQPEVVFEHDFAVSGTAPSNAVIHQPQPQGVIQGITGRGLLVQRPGVGPWCDLYVELPLVLEGDFDAEVAFDDFQSVGQEFGCAMMVIELSDPEKTQCRLLRLRDERQRQEIHVSLAKQQGAGERVYTTLSVLPTEAAAGRLRLVRQGKILHYLFAEYDSPHYRVLNSTAIPDSPTTTPGLHLHTMANLDGETSVIWRSLRVKADRMQGN